MLALALIPGIIIGTCKLARVSPMSRADVLKSMSLPHTEWWGEFAALSHRRSAACSFTVRPGGRHAASQLQDAPRTAASCQVGPPMSCRGRRKLDTGNQNDAKTASFAH